MNQQTEELRSDVFMRHAIELHRGAVIRLALGQTGSAADAQDVAQDTFIQLLKSTKTFTDDQHLRAWLLRVAHNRCLDLRRQAWRQRVELADDIEAIGTICTEDPAIEELFEHPIWTAMRQLPDKLRVALHLHYVENYSTEEIAQIVGCMPAAARARLHRGRKKLRDELVRMNLEQSGRTEQLVRGTHNANGTSPLPSHQSE